jgi:hypothetical protein
MKSIKILLVGLLLPMFSYATKLVDSDFEDGTMGDWVPKMSNECWEISSTTTLEGAKNLKAVDLDIAANVYAYTNVTFDVLNYDYEWKFMMDSNIDPTSGNKFWFWLAADKNDFNASDIKGYLVGVQYDSSNDNLSIWKVNGTSDITKIIESTFDVGTSPFSVQVTRSSGGLWTLYYNNDNSFDTMTLGGTATDTSITTGLTTTGPYFISTASNSGYFKFDACTINQETPSTVPTITSSESTDISVYVDEEVTFDITATVSASGYGGLFSTNKPSGSTFAEQTDDFPLSSTFAWTPDTVGSYSVVFTSTNETGATTLTINIAVEELKIYNLWINEFHYDNIGTDTDEGIEICGKAGINLSDYTIYEYNGLNGETNEIVSLSGIIPNEDNSNYGAVWFDIELQNGAPDGFALVKDDPEEVLYFLSYEGTFEGTDGPADGMTSIDVGVEESNTTTPVDYSLQLKGSGSYYEDFTWTVPSLWSHDLINDGQTLSSPTDYGTIIFIN